MSFRKVEKVIFVMISLFLVIGVYFYPLLPEKMASHWSIEGEVDGYVSKFWGLFLFTFVFAGIALLLILVPRIDPLKTNIEEFRRYYDRFIIIFSFLFLFIYLQTIFWNLGVQISPLISLPIGVGLLFFYIGVLCENAKRNWFIGIRTPWTLSSDKVWEKTHKIGGKLFRIAGLIAVLGVLFQRYVFILIILSVIVVTAYTIVYSYFEYRKEMKQRLTEEG